MKKKANKTADDWLKELVKNYQLPKEKEPKKILSERQKKIIQSKH